MFGQLRLEFSQVNVVALGRLVEVEESGLFVHSGDVVALVTLVAGLALDRGCGLRAVGCHFLNDGHGVFLTEPPSQQALDLGHAELAGDLSLEQFEVRLSRFNQALIDNGQVFADHLMGEPELCGDIAKAFALAAQQGFLLLVLGELVLVALFPTHAAVNFPVSNFAARKIRLKPPHKAALSSLAIFGHRLAGLAVGGDAFPAG